MEGPSHKTPCVDGLEGQRPRLTHFSTTGGAAAPLGKQMEGDALPCSRPAHYALRAIYDVLPQHRPVFRLSAPTFAAKPP